jgi:hypothetical protein
MSGPALDLFLSREQTMGMTARDLACLMEPRGWRLERAPKAPRLERWRWKLVYVPTGEDFTFGLLAEAERFSRACHEVESAVLHRARVLAEWHQSPDATVRQAVGTWLSGPRHPMPPILQSALACRPAAATATRRKRVGSVAGLLPPPGGHDLRAAVLACIAACEQRSLDAELRKATAVGIRSRL